MKSKLLELALAIAIGTYIAYDFVRTKYDRVYRAAAGESLYEKTHTKKKR